ncbi:MAG: hypothetical protein ACSLFP_15095, partial [Acidimicrobiales bacterium]
MRLPKLSFRALITALGVLMAIALVSGPTITAAQRSGSDPSAERERVREQRAEVATQVDALRATDAEVEKALDDLQANVAGQQGLLEEAERAATEAEAAYAEATRLVELKTAEIEELREQIRDFAVATFVRPPSDDALAALDSDDPSEAAEKRALLEVQSISENDLLDRLGAAEEDLEVQRQLAEDAANRATEKRAEAADRLGELQAARDQQAAYAEQVNSRLDRALAESAALEELDAELAAEIRADQARTAELARKAAAAARPAPSSGGGG